MQVDYGTALAPEVFQQHGHKLDPEGCVAIVAVTTGSASWNAGLRPGEFINHVGSKRIKTPEEFWEVVSQQAGRVRVQLTVGQGEKAFRDVAAP